VSYAPKQSHAAEHEDRDFKSDYASAFQPKGVAVRESFKPRYDPSAASAPFDGQTTHKADFTGNRGPKAKSAQPRGGLTDTIGVAIGAPDDRVFQTENRGQFAPKGVSVRESYAPKEGHTTKLPFEGASTTSSDFRAHIGVKPSTPFREAPTIGHAKEDRDFQSEAQIKFVPHGVQVRPSFAPSSRSRVTVPFEGESTTKADFRPWQRQPCPAHQLPPHDGISPDGHTLFTHDGGQWLPHSPQRAQPQ
jgi:hypothetical protein